MTNALDRTGATTRTERATTVVRTLRSIKLKRLDGGGAGTTQSFAAPRIIVGRSRACQLVVADPSVSALHFELRLRGNHVELRDLDSTNGTFIDERRVYRVELHPLDRFRAGDVRFELVEAGEVEIPVSAEDRFELLWGGSGVMREVFAELEALAGSELDVLLAGETGTGKQLAARSLHLRSQRSGAFVSVDCGTVTPAGLEQAFVEAHGGTLLLDELAELSAELQPRLLRRLEHREGHRSAELSEPTHDVRVIASTRSDLPKLVASGRFREDLYFRVAQAVVELPPLRERGDDVELLASCVLAEHAEATGQPAPPLGDDAREALRSHRWPGNVRELRNAIQRAALVRRGPKISASDLALIDHGERMGLDELLALPYREAHAQLDRFYLRRVMNETQGNITRAAQRLGTSRRALRERLKRVHLYAGD